MIPQYEYAIAVGYNQSTLTNVENLRAPGDWRNFYPPNAQTAFDPGTPRVRLDSLRYNTGFNSILWNFDLLTRNQYYYLKSQYCITDGYAGTVTINSPNANGTFTRFNAVMNIPYPNELERNFTELQKVQIQFIRLSALE